MENYEKTTENLVESVEEPTEVTKKAKKENAFVNLLLSDWRQYRKSQIIAINALLCALVLLFVLVPLKLGVLDLAVIPIIAIIISAEVLGVLNGVLTGLFFAFVSFFNHLARPGVLSPVFIQNPMVTFLPRILMPIMVFLAIKLLDYLFSKIKYNSEKSKKITPKILDTIKYSVGACFGVITNTAGVLGFMFAFYGGNTLNTGIAITAEFISGIIATNAVLELIVCALVTPAVTIAVKKTLSLTMKKRVKN